MHDVFPFTLHPKSQLRAAADASSLPRVEAPPPLDEKARQRQELEERYGLSMPVLELVKRYDVRNIHGEELAALGRILAEDGQYFDAFHSESRRLASTPDDQVFFFKFRQENSHGNALQFYQEELDFAQHSGWYEQPFVHINDPVGSHQRNVNFLQRLADIHDALQEEKSIKTADEAQLDRMYRSVKLDDFVDAHRGGQEYPDYPGQDWVEEIRQAMQERGVAVGEARTDKSTKEQYAALWQDYQRWEEAHPPTARVDVWV